MAYQSEIEKLEQRYEENPKQWFAALADAYRKEGSLDLALDYVRGGLEMRPNYASGYIVLGRCLVEKTEYAEAAQAFEQVLQLDAENIIALKSLGEIAELQSDFVGAKRWLQRLLEVDPMNDDARESLERVSQAAAAPPPRPAAVAREEPPAVDEEIAQAPEAAPTAEPGAAWAAEALGRPLESAPSMEPADERVEPVGIEAPAADEEPFRIEQFETEQPFGSDVAASDSGVEAFEIDKDEDRVLGQEPAVPIESVELEEPPVAAFGDVQQMEQEPVEVEHLDVGTFDDELAWDSGDRLSHEISDEDVVESVEHRDDLAPAVEFMEPAHEEAERETVEEAADFGALQAIPVMSEDMLTESAFEEPPAEEEVAGTEEEGRAAEAVAYGSPAMAAEEVTPGVPDEYRLEEAAEQTVEAPVPDAAIVDYAEIEQPAPAVEGAEPEPDLPLIMPDQEEAPAEAEPQPVVTETMAQVYAQQGLLPEARETYERLLEKRPDDPILKARLAELDARARSAARKQHASRYSALETGGPRAVAFLQQVFAGEAVDDFPPPTAPVGPEPDESESAMSPLQSAFGAETEEVDGAEAPGSPTVPAPDEVSLSSVFGESVAPNAPEEPDAGPGAPPSPPGGVSFDEFYGRSQGEVAEGTEEAPPSKAGSGEVSDDEFKDWLEGLKS